MAYQRYDVAIVIGVRVLMRELRHPSAAARRPTLLLSVWWAADRRPAGHHDGDVSRCSVG
jgi:hypothetical protein